MASNIEYEVGVPFAGAILPADRWTQTALKSYPEGRPLDWAESFRPTLLVAICQVGLGEIGRARASLETARKLAPEYIENRLAGNSVFRRPEERARAILFTRVAAGLEEPCAADTLR